MKVTRKTLTVVVLFAILIGATVIYGNMALTSNEASPASAPHTNGEATGVALSDEEALEKFENAFQLIQERYVDEVDQSKLVEGAIEGMLETLKDPYSVYMDPETASEFVQSLDSHFEGIGAEVSMTNGKVTIVAPFRDSPAERAGLQPNDKIIEIDDESIEGLSLYEAVLKIRGEKGTIVNLTIERPGATELITIPVERDEIPIETVRVNTLEHQGKTIGLLEITSFSEDTAARFEEGLHELEDQGIDGLLIDVRGNPGGYLNAVEEIGKLIIPGGEPIVQIEDRQGETMRYISSLDEKKPYPIVGITDRGSASASEILAAALKEAGNYDVVGETTFGKGTVQQTIQLGDGSEIKLSLFRWLTSAGNDINEKGVEPTVEVLQPDYFYTAPLTIEEPLEYDMLNEQIKNAQLMLKGLGFEPGRTDGYFSEQTKNAVTAFQNANELSATGTLNEETAAALQQSIVKLIQDKENDRQLKTALDLVVEQTGQ
ncbi:S41 family peptidase [Halalkalibacterium ligniniphilum]|uniref:S41 family peptidase n=1 Tax=Halalkalibacterium ligniniphilum TaxID=1134413 RepID=UPI00036DF4D1|nr:S41 family peptidase [Halalkalibacterium ligniniphilum]